MSSLAEQGVANTVLSQPSQSKQPTEDTNHHVNGAIDPSPPMKETTPPPQLQSSSTATAPASEAGLGVSAITESTPESPIKVPFLAPLPDSKPPTKPELTPEQEQKYNDLLTTVSGWTEAPTKSAAGAPIAPLTEEERMWLTRDRLLQYLRAVKWVAAEAPKRLLATIVWRREYGADRLTGDYISPENETGKQVILGYDKAARPCLYLIPSKQNTKKTDRQVEHLVFMVERVLDVMVPGQETLSLLVNFNESRSGSVPNPGQGKQVLNILQTHYPERLGRALVINLPWFINGFFKLITPFIDPMTREKLKFNED
ncbi:MAG: hypothetical protein M1833_003008, partial [Piccolia ochrophora]